MNSEMFDRLAGLSEKIATELVFAEAGKDLGLLPVNSLLGDIEQLVAENETPEDFRRASQIARKWVDAIFETTGTFDASTLARFGEWTSWWESAVQSERNQTPIPAQPVAWSKPGGISSPPIPVPVENAVGEEPTIVLNLSADGELLREFINESLEHLQNIEQGVLVLEENPSDADTLNSIFRAFHTFKGGSGFLNLSAIQNLAHELESLLDLTRQHKLAITPSVIALILEGRDTLNRFIDEIGEQVAGKRPQAAINVPTSRLMGSIRALIERNSSGLSPAASPPINVARMETEAVSTPKSTLGAPAIPSQPVVASEPAKAKPAKSIVAGSSVKVDTLKLDSLIDLVGEMVIAQSLVVQNPEIDSLRSEKLTRDLARLGQISRDLQRTAMSLRMVPIRSTFQKMNRLVHDLAAREGKQVELVTEGEDTELDRTIVEEIGDPLVHMIRNSLDHGIEKPEVRCQQGKPPQGTILLKAYHRGGNIVIEVKDDGAGLNRDKIIAKAIAMGLVKSDEQLTESQVYSLIMGAGFSTAEKVTDLSGRGVGMDVVRRNIEKLRGKIEIQSTASQGSTFAIHLPLTLAIIDGLLVGIGEHRYALPTLSICESFQPTAEMISTVHGRGEMINVRGKLMPLLRLYSRLGIKPSTVDPTKSIAVVVESGRDCRCVLVDQLLGKQEIVIKSLGETFSSNRCVAGAAILGDGRVGLILDPQGLVHSDTTVLEAAA